MDLTVMNQTDAIGKDVNKFKIKDKVVLTWIKGEGLEAGGGTLINGNQTINYGPISTFANYSIISENRITKVNSDFDFAKLSLFGCAITTGMGIIDNEIDLNPNDSIAIYGTGGVGLNVLIATKLKKANPIIAIDQSEISIYQNINNFQKKLNSTKFCAPCAKCYASEKQC